MRGVCLRCGTSAALSSAVGGLVCKRWFVFAPLRRGFLGAAVTCAGLVRDLCGTCAELVWGVQVLSGGVLSCRVSGRGR